MGSDLTADKIGAIVRSYGAFLEHSAPAPGCVADASKLPFPKAEIRQAMLMAMALTDDEDMRNNLRGAYLWLANWQENVGEADQGIDGRELSAVQDLRASARLAIEQAQLAKKWEPIVQKDLENLQRELALVESIRSK